MSSPEFELRWVRPPRQDRSRDTQARYVEAALRLLAAGRAFEDISVAELAKQAKSSIGAFYSRFRDKDALLHVLQIELNAEGSATGAHTFALAKRVDVPLEKLVRGFVELAVRYYREQHGLRRALLVEMCTNAELRARATALSEETCEGLCDVLAARYRKVRRDKLRDVVDVAHRMVYGALDQRLLFADDEPTGHALSDRKLVDEMSAAAHAYLLARLGAT